MTTTNAFILTVQTSRTRATKAQQMKASILDGLALEAEDERTAALKFAWALTAGKAWETPQDREEEQYRLASLLRHETQVFYEGHFWGLQEGR